MNKTACLRRLCAVMTAFSLLLIQTAAFAAQGTVKSNSLILRKSASQTGKALQTLDKGDSVTVHSSTGDWYKVTYGRYTGYVMKKYLKVTGKVESSGQSSTQQDGVPSAARPGEKGDHVKKLQQQLKAKGYYSGKIDGIYGSGTTDAVKAFQKNNGLTRDGIAGKNTMKKLFSSSAVANKTTKTKELKWFGNQNVIPKGATFTIKDCLTGKTFQAKRWSGANHIDAEPLTKDDAKTMKAVYGGKWSWDRRPILVKYNGHVYAASMNGMPHGTQTIKSNNFAGHFCIHFTGSKTHESKKVDPDHQQAVKTALKYTW